MDSDSISPESSHFEAGRRDVAFCYGKQLIGLKCSECLFKAGLESATILHNLHKNKSLDLQKTAGSADTCDITELISRMMPNAGEVSRRTEGHKN